jgi:hypothetical protein
MAMRHFVLLCAVALVPVSVEAQTTFWVESQNTVGSSGVIAPQINISASKKYSATAGVFLWSLVSDGWAENIVGGLWAPKPWIEFNLGAGIETEPKKSGRAMGSVFVGGAKGFIVAVGEQGGSGHWYLFEGNRSLGRIGVGFRAQRFVGVGPRIETDIAKKMKLWVVPYTWALEDETKGNLVVSLRVTP